MALVVAALTGCSAGTLPGGSNGGAAAAAGGTGGGATAANECTVAHAALGKVVTRALSSPFQKDDKCYFGVGPNGTKAGADLAQLYSDSVVVRYTTTDVASEYQGGKIAYSGSKPLNGVGTEAAYYDGGNGNPQIVARSAAAFCSVQTFFNDASEVGLSKPAGARTIAEADVPKLASDLGAVCNALFTG
jgi:hypothetical protein